MNSAPSQKSLPKTLAEILLDIRDLEYRLSEIHDLLEHTSTERLKDMLQRSNRTLTAVYQKIQSELESIDS